jgi:hypothetical protein
MDRQELVDRRVTAVGEGDVMYVVHWGREMEQAGFREESLHAKREFSVTSSPLPSLRSHSLLFRLSSHVFPSSDSWKHRSALEEAVSQPENEFSRLILEILLLHIDEPRSLSARGTAQNLGHYWAVDMMVDWMCGGRDKGALFSSAFYFLRSFFEQH